MKERLQNKSNALNIKKGYKQTKLGVIPEEWEVVELNEVGEVLKGLTYSPKDISDNGVLVLRSSNVQKRVLTFKDTVYVKVDKEKYNDVKEYDILICVRNGSKNLIGKNAIISKNEEGVAFGAFMAIYRSPFNKYFFQLFDTDYYKNQVHRNLGATINSINNGDLRKFKFPFPPKPQQIKIAKILSTWDTAINKQTQLIKAKQKQKKALMQLLLTGKKRFDGFTEVWKEVRLGEVAEITTGSSNREDSTLEGTYTFFDRSEDIRRSSRFLFEGEAVIVAGEGQRFIPKYFVGKFDLHQRTYAIMNFNNIDSKFIYYYLLQFKNYLLSQAVGSTVKSLRLPMFIKMPITSPSFKEQKKIAQVLSKSDKEIALLKEQLAQLQQQKQGLMQVLLTGKVLVKV